MSLDPRRIELIAGSYKTVIQIKVRQPIILRNQERRSGGSCQGVPSFMHKVAKGSARKRTPIVGRVCTVPSFLPRATESSHGEGFSSWADRFLTS